MPRSINNLNLAGGKIQGKTGSSLNTSGAISSSGGTISGVTGGASSTTTGGVTNFAWTNVFGNVINGFGATINNTGNTTDTLINLGTVNNSGTYNAALNNAVSGASVDNALGANWNGNVLTNVSGATITNEGTWTGDINNTGTLTTTGTITAASMTGLVNNSGGTVNAAGTIGGNVSNSGGSANGGGFHADRRARGRRNLDLHQHFERHAHGRGIPVWRLHARDPVRGARQRRSGHGRLGRPDQRRRDHPDGRKHRQLRRASRDRYDRDQRRDFDERVRAAAA